ncbi:MAG: transcription termination/antitermination factor NusG [Elusimicrobiaceae bacterium]|nr:transcription termination/antitermination factor NusG [Elusimicrobiaceae bacterium]
MAQETPTAWYVVHVQTGYEEKVRKKILLDVETHQMGEQIFQALVPTEEVREVKQNKEIRHQRKFFPSYVLVEMKMTSEAYWFIRNITGVTGFLGGSSPVPLPEEDIKEILERIENPDGKPKYLVEFKRGESVRITEGPFKHFIGVVEEVNEQKNKLKVMVTVFDRATPVEVDFLQVEKN